MLQLLQRVLTVGASMNFSLVVALRFSLVRCRAAGTQFTCFTGTKVPILTQQQWRPDEPATLTWVEALDGGDPKVLLSAAI